MADLSLTINYRALPRRTAYTVCGVWGTVGLVLVGAIAWHLKMTKGLLAEWWWLALLGWLVGGLAYLYVPFRIMTACLEGSRLVGDQTGLLIPSRFYGIGPAKSLEWASISGVDFVDEDAQRKLVLRTHSNETITVDMTEVAKDDVHALLLAVEVWAINATWTSRAITFRDEVQISNLGIEAESFTKLWDAELNRRFSATTFVPHAPGTTLRSETLKITRQLAFGGFSAIYQARDNNGNDVVLKECVVPLDRQDPASQKSLELFDREAHILKKIDHAQIAKVFDHFVEHDRAYLVLQYIKGANLREIVERDGSLSEAAVIKLLAQMIDILNYLHGLEPPVVHRDFTPDNLVLSNEGVLHLVDFGAAAELTTRATGTMIGKQGYIAPEQLRGKATPQSDLYALGCTMHFLLTGKEPEALSIQKPGHWKSISPWLSELVQKLTAQDESSRFASARQVAEAIASQTGGGATINLRREAGKPA